MGIDISMSIGFGVHITDEQIKNAQGYDEDYGEWEFIEKLTLKHGLTYGYAGNSWSGEDNGYVIYARSSYRGFDMGREAEAGVYRGAGKPPYTGEEEIALNEACVEVTGRIMPIEWLVTVGVS